MGFPENLPAKAGKGGLNVRRGISADQLWVESDRFGVSSRIKEQSRRFWKGLRTETEYYQ